MKFRKIQSVLLAAAMAFTILPLGSIQALAAATKPTTPTTTKPVLSFEKGDDGDSGKASIVTGRSIDILETFPGTVTFVRESMTIKNNAEGGSYNAGITVNKDSISVAEAFNPGAGTEGGSYTPESDPATKGDFNVTGNYYTVTAEGVLWEENTASGAKATGYVRSDTPSAITMLSSITLRCTSAEKLNQEPGFEVVPDSASGSLEKFEGGDVGVISYTQDPKKQKEIRLAIQKGNYRIELTLNPKLQYSFETDDKGNQILVDDGTGNKVPVPKETDNFVREGTTFRLDFQLPQSNPIMLTVYTPQAAMNEVETRVENSAGSRLTDSDRKEIDWEKLTDAQKEKLYAYMLSANNDFGYITGNFMLRQYIREFNARFKIEWEWRPADPADQNAIIKEGTNTEWQQMTVTAQEDDITGTLEATVYYETKEGSGVWQKSNTGAISKPVTIRGRGKLVGVTQVQEIGESGTKRYPVADPDAPEDEKTTDLPGIKTLDAYKGNVPGLDIHPVGPYQYDLQLNMGAKNGAAKYASVTVDGKDDVAKNSVVLRTWTGSDTPRDYTPGAEIFNPQTVLSSETPGLVNLSVIAQQLPPKAGPQQVTLTFRFFVQDRNGQIVPSSEKFSITINVRDSSPSQDSSLTALEIRDQENEKIEYPFASDQLSYTQNTTGTVHIPWKSEEITLTPFVNSDWGRDKPMSLTWYDSSGKQIGGPEEIFDGQKSVAIPFEKANSLVKLKVLVKCEDPRETYWSTYELDVIRDLPSDDATLKSLGIYFEDDSEMANNLISNFDPAETEYSIEVPYSTNRLRIRAEKNHKRAKGPTITPELVGNNQYDKDLQWLDGLKTRFTEATDGIVDVTFEMLAEDGVTTRTYTVHMRRLDPNNDPTLSGLLVGNADEENVPYEPGFKADTLTYTADIPYQTKQIKLNITPTDLNVSNIQIYSLNKDHLVFEMSQGQVKAGAWTSAMDVLPIDDDTILRVGHHTFYIVVTAENETDTQEYELRVRRAEPSDDALLKSLELQDQDGNKIKTFGFHPDETSYSLKVPYETNGVSFTPNTNHMWATVQINEGTQMDIVRPYVIASGKTSKVFKLNDPGNPKEFQVVITAEDGETQKTYNISIDREPPSSDARLKGLKVDNAEEFSPVFVSNETDYSATIPEGVQGAIITATVNQPGATIRIGYVLSDGSFQVIQAAESGKPSDMIEIIEVNQTIGVEVTAQDGETKIIYKINFTNENLVEKTNNADLRSLVVNKGQMTPDFQAAVTEYEVAVTEDTWSVDIIPRVADPLATMRVLAGTKEIGDYNGNYALALVDGENAVTIEVTSPDGTTVKNYSLKIYRNEEGKLKNLTPLEAEQVDYKNSDNVITVMISEYPRVGASVFNTLRDYPEKTIVFQGNDYSLEFKASDIDRVVPQKTVYDFRMSFDSPDSSDIYSEIDSYQGNGDIINRAVFVYFEDGSSDDMLPLPGPAVLHLNLGNKYGSQTLYWHYYNRARERIDYYGTIRSNKQGTVAVRIDHFSTYIVTPFHRIVGSEDLSSSIDALGAGGKTNPYTGLREVRF